jgi:hypothetical protein
MSRHELVHRKLEEARPLGDSQDVPELRLAVEAG